MDTQVFDSVIWELQTLKAEFESLKNSNEEYRKRIVDLESENKALRESVKILGRKRKSDRKTVELWRSIVPKDIPTESLAMSPSTTASEPIEAAKSSHEDLSSEATRLATSPPQNQRPLAASIAMDPLSSPVDTQYAGNPCSSPSQGTWSLTALGVEPARRLSSDDEQASESHDISPLTPPELSRIPATPTLNSARRTKSLNTTRIPNAAGDRGMNATGLNYPTRTVTVVGLPTPVTVKQEPSQGGSHLESLLRRDWHPSDFVVNPAYTSGRRDYAFTEKVTGNKRRCLHGTKCSDCDKFYSLLAQAQNNAMCPLGQETPTKLAVQKSSRHREMWKRQDTPYGYWQSDIPTTQEQERDKLELARQRTAEAYERLREALVGGRYLFRDKALREAVEDKSICKQLVFSSDK